MGTSAIGSQSVAQDRKVAASSGDSAGFLDAKVDATTMTVVGDKLVRAALTGDVTTALNVASVVGGNADTVTTNADLTGIVTSTGNATAIANKAIALAKLADGTDGELITWDAAGVAATVAVGTSGDVLTSGGAGVAPTFAAPAAGGAMTFIGKAELTSASTTGTLGTLVANTNYKIFYYAKMPVAGGQLKLNTGLSGGAHNNQKFNYSTAGGDAANATADAVTYLLSNGAQCNGYVEFNTTSWGSPARTGFFHGQFQGDNSGDNYGFFSGYWGAGTPGACSISNAGTCPYIGAWLYSYSNA